MTTTRIGYGALLAIALFLWSGNQASAECITIPGESPAARTKMANLVFVADVLSVEAVDRPPTFRYRVRFTVIADYKGNSASGERVLDFRANSVEFRFEKGQRVLVYAQGPADDASTGCSGARVIKLDDPELEVLRQLARDQPVQP
jgi:hypothetical protein